MKNLRMQPAPFLEAFIFFYYFIMSSSKYELHAVVIKKKIPLSEAKKISQKFIKNENKKFYREEGDYYRFRNESKQKFKKDTFRSKKINDNIYIVLGEMK